MYLKSRVKIPDVHGKLTRLRRGDITYIKYEYDRYYDPEKKYTYPQRATIGKVCADDDTMMIPNEAFLKYFPDAVLSGMEDRTERRWPTAMWRTRRPSSSRARKSSSR